MNGAYFSIIFICREGLFNGLVREGKLKKRKNGTAYSSLSPASWKITLHCFHTHQINKLFILSKVSINLHTLTLTMFQKQRILYINLG